MQGVADEERGDHQADGQRRDHTERDRTIDQPRAPAERRELRNCSSPSRRNALESLDENGNWTSPSNGPVTILARTQNGLSEVDLRPEAEHQRRLGEFQGGWA